MGTYAGDSSTYNSSIYIFDPSDFVIGAENGTTNVPVKQLADNSSYLKKFKGTILRGNGTPTVAVLPSNFDLDSDVTTNLLYLDEDTGNFWKPTDITATNWENIYRSASLNVGSLRLNEDDGTAADETNYLDIKFDSLLNELQVLETDGTTLGDFKVDKMNVGSLQSSDGGDTINVSEDEILILFNITNNGENSDAFFSAKNMEDLDGVSITSFETDYLSDGSLDKWNLTLSTGDLTNLVYSNGANVFINIYSFSELTGQVINNYYKVVDVVDATDTGETSSYITTDRTFQAMNVTPYSPTNNSTGLISIDNSAQIKWDTTLQQWSFIKRDGTSLSINANGFIINGVNVGFISDTIIETIAQFNSILNTGTVGGNYLTTPFYYVIKPHGSGNEYLLNTDLIISSSNIRIETIGGAYIKFSDNDVTIKTDNNSIVPMDTYFGNTLQILNQDNYRTGGTDNGDEITYAVADNVTIYSDISKLNQKYTIEPSGISKKIKTAHDKRTTIRPDLLKEINLSEPDAAVSGNVNTSEFDSLDIKIGSTLYNIIAYNYTEGANDGVWINQFKKSSENYSEDESAVGNNLFPIGTTYSNIKLNKNVARVQALGSNGVSSIVHSWLDFSGTGIDNDVDSTNDANITVNNFADFDIASDNDDTAYIAYINTSSGDIRIKYMTHPGGSNGSYVWGSATDVTFTNSTDVDTAGEIKIIFEDDIVDTSTGGSTVYGKGIILYRSLSNDIRSIVFDRDNGQSGTGPSASDASIKINTGISDVGNKIIARKRVVSSVNEIYVAFSSLSTTIDDSLNITKLDLSSPIAPNLPLSNNSINISLFTIDSATRLFTLVGYDGSGITGQDPIYVTYSSEHFPGSYSSFTVSDAVPNVGHFRISGINNDHINLTYNDPVTSRNVLLSLHYIIDIRVTSNFQTSTTEDFILSKDFIENTTLDLVVDGGSQDSKIQNVRPMFDFSNTRNSNIKLNITNTVTDQLISCGNSDLSDKDGDASGVNGYHGYNNTFQIISGDNTISSTILNNFHLLRYANINNSNIVTGSGTSDKSFDLCEKINYIGFIDGDPFIGNGDFDE